MANKDFLKVKSDDLGVAHIQVPSLSADQTYILPISGGTLLTDASLIGPTGSTGPTGMTGATGPQGNNGNQGNDGPMGISFGTISVNQIYHLFDTGNVLMFDGTNYIKAVYGSYPIIGIVGQVIDPDNFILISNGLVENITNIYVDGYRGLIPGIQYYLDYLVPGGLWAGPQQDMDYSPIPVIIGITQESGYANLMNERPSNSYPVFKNNISIDSTNIPSIGFSSNSIANNILDENINNNNNAFLYFEKEADRQTPKYHNKNFNNNNQYTALQNHIGHGKVGIWNPNGDGNTPNTGGIANFSTYSEASTTIDTALDSGILKQSIRSTFLVGAGTISNTGGIWQSAAKYYLRDGGFVFIIKFGLEQILSDTSGAYGPRAFIGLSSTIAPLGSGSFPDDPGTMINTVGIRLTDASQSSWSLISGGLIPESFFLELDPAIFPVNDKDMYELMLVGYQGNLSYRVTRLGYVGEKYIKEGQILQADLPIASTLLSCRAWAWYGALGSNPYLSIGSVYIEAPPYNNF